MLVSCSGLLKKKNAGYLLGKSGGAFQNEVRAPYQRRELILMTSMHVFLFFIFLFDSVASESVTDAGKH